MEVRLSNWIWKEEEAKLNSYATCFLAQKSPMGSQGVHAGIWGWDKTMNMGKEVAREDLCNLLEMGVLGSGVSLMQVF